MNKAVLYAILAVAVLGFANSQSYLAASANASIIVIPVNSSYSHTIKLNSAYFAETYITSLLGQAYYNDYINLSGGSYYGNVTHAYFTYSVPFANGSQSGGLQRGRRLGITITLNGSRVVDYIGPKKPYILEVNSSTAVDTAESLGLFNDTARLVGLFGTNTTSASEYSIAWAVLSQDAEKGQNYYGVYVDAVTGNVVGEFYYAPWEVQNSSTQGYGTAGNFSLFLLSPVAQTQVPVAMYVYYIIFAIIVVAAIAAWMVFKPKKKSKFKSVLSGASS